MLTADRELLKTEAIRSLRSYRSTGIRGFLQKATDRLRAIDITTKPFERTPEGIDALILALETGILGS